MDILKSDKEPDELKRFNHNLKSFCRVNLMIDPQIVLERLSCEDFDSEEDYLTFIYKIHLIMDRRYTHQDQITEKTSIFKKSSWEC